MDVLDALERALPHHLAVHQHQVALDMAVVHQVGAGGLEAVAPTHATQIACRVLIPTCDPRQPAQMYRRHLLQ
jgi:hypothetical protein